MFLSKIFRIHIVLATLALSACFVGVVFASSTIGTNISTEGSLTASGTTTLSGLILSNGSTMYYGNSLLIDSSGNINATIIPLQDTSANLASVVPASGELVYETDTKYAKMGTGIASLTNIFPLNPWSRYDSTTLTSAYSVHLASDKHIEAGGFNSSGDFRFTGDSNRLLFGGTGSGAIVFDDFDSGGTNITFDYNDASGYGAGSLVTNAVHPIVFQSNSTNAVLGNGGLGINLPGFATARTSLDVSGIGLFSEGVFAYGQLGTTPGISSSTGAGTGPSTSITGNANAVKVNLTTGSSPAGSNATIVTVTLAQACPTGLIVVVSPANAAAALLSGTTGVFASSISNQAFKIASGSSALTGSTNYIWNAHIDCY